MPNAIRREPYRLFFPLGIALSWVGVVPWFLLGAGASQDYPSIFHSMVQIQGFMTCFALGFLFTFIPRFTRTWLPSGWEIGIAVFADAALVLSAWQERWAVSQVFWWILLGDLVLFASRRVRAAKGFRLPPRFVWVALALVFGFTSSVLTAIGGVLGGESMWIHDVGRGLVLQGMFAALVLGIGGMLLPTIAHGAPRPDSAPVSGSPLPHVAAGCVLAASFAIEAKGHMSAGFALRAIVVAVELASVPGTFRYPTRRGLHRRLVWAAVWMLPASYVFVALAPTYRRIGLHVGFIGCYALLALGVSLHVIFSHGGRPQLLERSPWPVALMVGLLVTALGARLLVDLVPSHLLLWLALAAGSFLCATIAWGAAVAPSIIGPPTEQLPPGMNSEPAPGS